jgi:hypothetical protein
MILNRQCLGINASYEAINVTSARRALTLVFKGAAVVEEVSTCTIRTSKINVPLPSVIRLMKYRRMPRLNRSVSRKGIMLKQKSAEPQKKAAKGSRLVGRLNRAASVQIALRLPGPDMEKARELATRKGIGYQTLLKMLVHEGLRRETRRAD